MTYKAKEWINTVYDDEGNILRKGTPLMAEDLNRVDGTLEKVVNSRGNPKGIATLDEKGIIHSTQLPTNLKEIRVVANLAERNILDKFEGLRVLVTDATEDETVSNGWAEYVWNGIEFIKVAEAESLDIVLDWANLKNKPSEYPSSFHRHDAEDITDLYVTHEHSNKDIIDNITQGTINQIKDNEERIESLESGSSQLHSHNNKPTLDKVVYSGAKQQIDLITIEEMENHTHGYSSLEDKPTKLSEFENDKGYLTEIPEGVGGYIIGSDAREYTPVMNKETFLLQETFAYPLASIVFDDKHMYALKGTRVEKYDLSTMASVGYTENFSTPGTITLDDEYVYVASKFSTSPHIRKYLKSNLSLTAVQSGTLGATPMCLTNDVDFVYAGLNNGQVAQIRKSDMVYVATQASSTTSVYSLVLAGGDRLFACGTANYAREILLSPSMGYGRTFQYGATASKLTADENYLYIHGTSNIIKKYSIETGDLIAESSPYTSVRNMACRNGAIYVSEATRIHRLNALLSAEISLSGVSASELALNDEGWVFISDGTTLTKYVEGYTINYLKRRV